MLQRLEGQLGPLPEPRAGEPPIELVFVIEERNGISYGTLTLIVGDVREQRTAASPSCADVLTALSMMAAVAIGEERGRAAPAAPEAPQPQAPDARRRAPVDSSRIVPAPRRLAFALGSGIEGNGNRGTVVALGTWFAQVTVLRGLAPEFRVGLARSAPQDLRSVRGDVSLRWTEATFTACGDLARNKELRVAPCLDVELGRLQATVLAPAPARTSAYLWLTSGVSAKVAWRPLPPLSVEVAVGARAPLIRSRLFFEPDNAVVYHPPAVVPFVAARLVTHLP